VLKFKFCHAETRNEPKCWWESWTKGRGKKK